MSVQFLRVVGIRGNKPAVLAVINDWLVKWHPRNGWTCQCLTPEDEHECEHIMVIKNLLHPKITTGDTRD